MLAAARVAEAEWCASGAHADADWDNEEWSTDPNFKGQDVDARGDFGQTAFHFGKSDLNVPSDKEDDEDDAPRGRISEAAPKERPPSTRLARTHRSHHVQPEAHPLSELAAVSPRHGSVHLPAAACSVRAGIPLKSSKKWPASLQNWVESSLERCEDAAERANVQRSLERRIAEMKSSGTLGPRVTASP